MLDLAASIHPVLCDKHGMTLRITRRAEGASEGMERRTCEELRGHWKAWVDGVGKAAEEIDVTGFQQRFEVDSFLFQRKRSISFERCR